MSCCDFGVHGDCSQSEAVSSLLSVPNVDSGIFLLIPIALFIIFLKL